MGNLVPEFLDFVDMPVLITQDAFEHFALSVIVYLLIKASRPPRPCRPMPDPASTWLLPAASPKG
jgi:hypothetical protein